jgi:hypothetical protein
VDVGVRAGRPRLDGIDDARLPDLQGEAMKGALISNAGPRSPANRTRRFPAAVFLGRRAWFLSPVSLSRGCKRVGNSPADAWNGRAPQAFGRATPDSRNRFTGAGVIRPEVSDCRQSSVAIRRGGRRRRDCFVAEAVARRSRADHRASATWLGWVHQPRLRASTSRYSKRSSVGPSGGPAFAFVANSRNSRSRFALRSGSSSTLANAATTGPKVRL